MKEIPPAFRQNGFEFKLLLREGNIALFRKTKPGLGFEIFEVVIIQRHDTFVIHGKEIEAAEHVPSSEQWGVKGWTYSDRVSAGRKFDQLKLRASAFASPFRCPDPQTKSKALWRKTVHQETAIPRDSRPHEIQFN
jgi:hypothetical protein